MKAIPNDLAPFICFALAYCILIFFAIFWFISDKFAVWRKKRHGEKR